MKIEIIEKNYDVGVKLKNLIEKKINRLKKYFGEEAKCKVVCKKDNKQYKLEINITSKNAFFRSEVVGDNMYTNLDLALPKLERQIVKFNGKRRDMAIPKIEDLLYIEDLPEENDPIIRRRKSFKLNPITELEAVELLETLDHDFYVFLNSKTNNTNVLYKRINGEYGIIEVYK